MKKRNLYSELNVESEEICAPYVDTDVIKEKVTKSISSVSCERKVTFMKSKKKIIVLAAAAVMLLSITAYAASTIITTWYSSASPKDRLSSLPTSNETMDELGYTPDLIEKFSNGYSFDGASYKNNALSDENGKIAEKFKSLSVSYTKGDERVYFSADKFISTVDESGELYKSINGIDFYAHSFNNKIVPSDYEMTAEDKKAEAEGRVYFNEDGIDHFEDHFINSVTWKKDGIQYNLMQSNGTLSIDDLINMATEIINQ